MIKDYVSATVTAAKILVFTDSIFHINFNLTFYYSSSNNGDNRHWFHIICLIYSHWYKFVQFPPRRITSSVPHTVNRLNYPLSSASGATIFFTKLGSQIGVCMGSFVYNFR